MNGHKEEVALELFKTVFGKDFDPVEIMNEAMRKPKPKKKQKRYFDEDDSDDEDDDDYSEQPQSLEEFKASVEAHMEEWLANNEQAQRGKDLPPITVIDDGSNSDVVDFIDDPVWRKRVEEKEIPENYWEHFVKGRKAWQKKYLPGIPHGGRYRVYFHTPEGPLERVSAWASYVLPGKQNAFSFSTI